MIAEPGVTHKCRAKVHAGIRPDKQKGLAGSRRQGLQKIHNRRRIVAATVSEPGRRERARGRGAPASGRAVDDGRGERRKGLNAPGSRCSRSLHRITLIVETNDILGDINLVRGENHRSLLRGVIQDDRVSIVLRIFIQDVHELPPDAVHDVLLGIVRVILKFLLLPLKRAGQLIAFAREPGLLLIAQG